MKFVDMVLWNVREHLLQKFPGQELISVWVFHYGMSSANTLKLLDMVDAVGFAPEALFRDPIATYKNPMTLPEVRANASGTKRRVSLSDLDPQAFEIWTTFLDWLLRFADDEHPCEADFCTRIYFNFFDCCFPEGIDPDRVAACVDFASGDERQIKKQFADMYGHFFQLYPNQWRHGLEHFDCPCATHADFLFGILDWNNSGIIDYEEIAILTPEMLRLGELTNEAERYAIEMAKDREKAAAGGGTLQPMMSRFEFKMAQLRRLNKARRRAADELERWIMQKYGHKMRAWLEIDNDRSMQVSRIEFMKWCAAVGFTGDRRAAWSFYDKDESGDLSVDEWSLDASIGMGQFQAWFRSRFCCQTELVLHLFRWQDRKVGHLTEHQFVDILIEMDFRPVISIATIFQPLVELAMVLLKRKSARGSPTATEEQAGDSNKFNMDSDAWKTRRFRVAEYLEEVMSTAGVLKDEKSSKKKSKQLGSFLKKTRQLEEKEAEEKAEKNRQEVEAIAKENEEKRKATEMELDAAHAARAERAESKEGEHAAEDDEEVVDGDRRAGAEAEVAMAPEGETPEDHDAGAAPATATSTAEDGAAAGAQQIEEPIPVAVAEDEASPEMEGAAASQVETGDAGNAAVTAEEGANAAAPPVAEELPPAETGSIGAAGDATPDADVEGAPAEVATAAPEEATVAPPQAVAGSATEPEVAEPAPAAGVAPEAESAGAEEAAPGESLVPEFAAPADAAAGPEESPEQADEAVVADEQVNVADSGGAPAPDVPDANTAVEAEEQAETETRPADDASPPGEHDQEQEDAGVSAAQPEEPVVDSAAAAGAAENADETLPETADNVDGEDSAGPPSPSEKKLSSRVSFAEEPDIVALEKDASVAPAPGAPAAKEPQETTSTEAATAAEGEKEAAAADVPAPAEPDSPATPSPSGSASTPTSVGAGGKELFSKSTQERMEEEELERAAIKIQSLQRQRKARREAYEKKEAKRKAGMITLAYVPEVKPVTVAETKRTGKALWGKLREKRCSGVLRGPVGLRGLNATNRSVAQVLKAAWHREVARADRERAGLQKLKSMTLGRKLLFWAPKFEDAGIEIDGYALVREIHREVAEVVVQHGKLDDEPEPTEADVEALTDELLEFTQPFAVYLENRKKFFRELFFSVGADAKGDRFLYPDDLNWLRHWDPQPWLLALPDFESAADLRNRLRSEHCNNDLAVWKAMDADASNKVTWTEIEEALNSILWEDCDKRLPGAWRALDTHRRGYITLHDYSSRTVDLLQPFFRWVHSRFRSYEAAMKFLEGGITEGRKDMGLLEFRERLRLGGYKENCSGLLQLLDLDGGGTVTPSEIMFLEVFDMELTDSTPADEEAARKAAITVAKRQVSSFDDSFDDRFLYKCVDEQHHAEVVSLRTKPTKEETVERNRREEEEAERRRKDPKTALNPSGMKLTRDLPRDQHPLWKRNIPFWAVPGVHGMYEPHVRHPPPPLPQHPLKPKYLHPQPEQYEVDRKFWREKPVLLEPISPTCWHPTLQRGWIRQYGPGA